MKDHVGLDVSAVSSMTCHRPVSDRESRTNSVCKLNVKLCPPCSGYVTYLDLRPRSTRCFRDFKNKFSLSVASNT